MHRLFTAMSGSVVAVADVPNPRKRKASTTTPKPKAQRTSTRTTNEPEVNLPPEPLLSQVTVDCKYGVRNKLWIDDLVSCALHTVRSLESQFGDYIAPHTLQTIKVQIIRLGIRFAFLGDVTVTTSKGNKKFTKWSLLRPALQAYGIDIVTQARALSG